LPLNGLEHFLQLGGGAEFLLFLPLLCCLVNMFQKNKARRAQSKAPTESEIWVLSSGIQDSYKKLSSKTLEWTKTPKTVGSVAPRAMTLANRKGVTQNVWVLETSTPPRLLKLTNDNEGEAAFELKEQEGGGTSIKVNYSYGAEKKIHALQSDLHVDETLEDTSDKSCINCSKSLLREFDFCPYCGSKQSSV